MGRCPWIEGSETSAIRTKTPGNYPKENILQIYIYTHTHAHTYICIYIYMYVCVCVCVCVCVKASARVRVCNPHFYPDNSSLLNSETQLLTNWDYKFPHRYLLTLPTDKTCNVHQSNSLSKLNDTDSAIMIRVVQMGVRATLENYFGPPSNGGETQNLYTKSEKTDSQPQSNLGLVWMR